MIIGELLLGFSAVTYAVFWLWAVIHAINTPRATAIQRALWGVAMIVNPATAIWYWYVWKRWAFWALFTPLLGFSISLPLIIRSVFSRAEETVITNALYGLGSARLMILVAVLMIFPLLLRLAALLHIGKNTELTAKDRNDWIVSMALPVFGFGAGIAYCAKERRVWALVGLIWIAVIGLTFKGVTVNISKALQPAGEEKREEFKFYSSSSS